MPTNDAMWNEIASAPFDLDLELAVIDKDGPHVLVFPCRRMRLGWVNAETHRPVEIHPTHWRGWAARPAMEDAGRH